MLINKNASKSKNNSWGTAKNLVEELNIAEEVITTTANDTTTATTAATDNVKGTSHDVERKGADLLKLAESKEISKTPSYIAKASAKVINKVYAEWEEKTMERATHFLCDQLISKFRSVLGGLDAIEKLEEMEKELKNDPLLREDVERVVSMLTPWIPFIGILSCGITVGKYVLDHTGKKIADGFARGPFSEVPPEERSEEEIKNGYNTVN